MAWEIGWERSDYESRVDVGADDIESFVAAVLDTIDLKAARASPNQWQKVCEHFAGCARTAKAQGATPRDGGRRIAAHLHKVFPGRAGGSNDRVFEFMDWLADPGRFEPTALRGSLKQS